MIELAKAVKKGLLLLWKEPATHILVLVNGSVGPNGVNAGQKEWLTDKESSGFYGSCIVLIQDESSKKQIVERNAAQGGIRIDRHKIEVSEVSVKKTL